MYYFTPLVSFSPILTCLVENNVQIFRQKAAIKKILFHTLITKGFSYFIKHKYLISEE